MPVYHFRDIESGELVTIEQLYSEYQMNVENGNTAPCLFSEYVWDCLTINNGTLIDVTNKP